MVIGGLVALWLPVCMAVLVSAQIAPEAAPELALELAPSSGTGSCVDTAPDCEAVCNQEPGNVEDACSLQTPIGDYLRCSMCKLQFEYNCC